MNSNADFQSCEAIIQQSLEELDILLSTLEEQFKSGLFSTQPTVETIEMPEDRSLVLEDTHFLTDWV